MKQNTIFLEMCNVQSSYMFHKRHDATEMINSEKINTMKMKVRRFKLSIEKKITRNESNLKPKNK